MDKTANDDKGETALKSGAATYVTGSSAPPRKAKTLEQSIGAFIRQQRRRLDLKGGDLAAAASISTSMLSKIENGQISPSLGTLQALAQALNAPLTAFFASHEERRDCCFVKAGQGAAIERRGTKAGHHYNLLGHSIAGDVVVEPYLITLSDNAAPYTAFQHEGVELIYMLTGKVVYKHSDQTYALEPGDTLLFDATAPHGPEALTQLPMTYLSVIVYSRP
ncbi:MAG: XRE family transcriptional regulator [Hyphomicrobiales bacterium]|nr:XRE family transcriptional regulator [Hyphomicrobiales bacterium]